MAGEASEVPLACTKSAWLGEPGLMASATVTLTPSAATSGTCGLGSSTPCDVKLAM